MVVADVDCTVHEKLCERHGVEGYPTLKYYSPPDDEGEDYEGGRDLSTLREFTSKLGPGCSPATREACSEAEAKELDELLAVPLLERLQELTALRAKVSGAQEEHDELLKTLQEKYEASETSLEALKKETKPRMKMLRASTAPAPDSTAKDEM